jgi:MFS transporter, FHS family, glucose/mannose:H+ symporter
MYKGRLVFWAACTGMLLFGISLITLGSVASEMRVKLQMDEITAGALFSILPLGILSGSLLFGPIVDKYGYKLLLAIAALFMFVGFEGIAFTYSSGFLKLYIFIFGFGGGAINGATNALVSDISERGRGANLSLLGVFYGLGALGMPLVTGILEKNFGYEVILAAIGSLALVAGVFFMIIKFPPPKQIQGIPLAKSFLLLKDSVLILIGFFLFLQSGFEGIMNNWITTYLIDEQSVAPQKALFALTAMVAGLTGMRLLIGSVFRGVPENKLLFSSFGLIIVGLIILKIGFSYNADVAGLVILGAGLAAGFPIMLGIVGSRYAELSGTAFSIVFFIAMIGNMLINYGTGIIAQNFGIDHLFTVALGITIIMIVLFLIILQKNRNSILTL